MIAEVNKAVKETGVAISSLVPVFGWSAPDEQERQAQVRNWKRLLLPPGRRWSRRSKPGCR